MDQKNTTLGIYINLWEYMDNSTITFNPYITIIAVNKGF